MFAGQASAQPAATDTELARAEEGARRGGTKTGSLVINPDGCTYSYAVKIEAVSEGSTSKHDRAGSTKLEEAEAGRCAEGDSSGWTDVALDGQAAASGVGDEGGRAGSLQRPAVNESNDRTRAQGGHQADLEERPGGIDHVQSSTSRGTSVMSVRLPVWKFGRQVC